MKQNTTRVYTSNIYELFIFNSVAHACERYFNMVINFFTSVSHLKSDLTVKPRYQKFYKL